MSDNSDSTLREADSLLNFVPFTKKEEAYAAAYMVGRQMYEADCDITHNPFTVPELQRYCSEGYNDALNGHYNEDFYGDSDQKVQPKEEFDWLKEGF